MEPPESAITTDTGSERDDITWVDSIVVGTAANRHGDKMVGFRVGHGRLTVIYPVDAVRFAEALMQVAAKIGREGGVA